MPLQRNMLFLHKNHTFHHEIIHHMKIYINVGEKIIIIKENKIKMIPKIYYKLTQYSPALHMKSHHFIDLHDNP